MRVMTMRTAGQPLSAHRLSLEDRPVPHPQDSTDVVVRIAAAGVCRTDLHLLSAEMTGPLPLVLGHENAGWVHEVGPGVTTVEVGDPVLCFPFITGGLSPAERAGLETADPDRRTPGITVDGGYADYLLTNERAMLKVPADADLASLATLTDAGLAAYRAARKAAAILRPGDTALVIGVGGLGHLGVQILRALSPAAVVAVDTAADARQLALDCGADRAIAPDEVADAVGDGVRACLDFVGSDATAALGFERLEFGGCYLAVGVGGALSFPLAALVEGERRVEGVYVGTYRDLVEVTELVLSGAVTPRVVRYGLEQANEALEDLAAGRILGRAVLEPHRAPSSSPGATDHSEARGG